MIEKREIIDAATALGLNPHVVEKDYVLGWLLWGIANHPAIAENWVFKGGTCLKKCFFETYRFSEDLDFTLKDESQINAEFLAECFSEISEQIYERTGIELPTDHQVFDIHENPRGRVSCQGKIGYQGPVSPKGKNIPRIKLDLTADERLVLAPAYAPVFHPYSDAPDDGINVLAYAYEEAFGEKVRALAERTRPRDLYDVINLFRNDEARPAPAVLLDVIRQKCEFKGIGLPTMSELEPHRVDLEGGWATMLAHQLPALPQAEVFWDQLPAFFQWLEGGTAPSRPASYRMAAGEEVIRERTLRLRLPTESQSYIEIIRFAASNRLCVELMYQGSSRRIEPYSLRRTKDGNIILHAHNIDKDEHRSYRIDRIQGAQITNQPFSPRFEIELTPSGPVSIRPTTIAAPVPTSSRLSRGGLRPRKASRPRIGRRPKSIDFGPRFIYECTYCGKRFKRKKQATSLNPHKDKDGYPCSGRYAYLVDTEY